LDEAGNFQGAIAIITDNTSQKQTEAELIREQLKLEHRVKERTKELVETNQALSVLARNIDQKRERVQEKTTRAVNSKIFPIIEQFQKNKAFAKHRTEIDVLKAYLKDLTAEAKDEPNIIFILSKAELRVATMIKNGFSSPEIARMLSVSQDTVKTHRKNIRRKLNICNTKINLTTYLRAKLG
jgi:DNA-binding NarL/FixJ family response regulator